MAKTFDEDPENTYVLRTIFLHKRSTQLLQLPTSTLTDYCTLAAAGTSDIHSDALLSH